jgi:hypothetical protein
MKNIKIILTALTLCFAVTTNAQFLKKLKEKAEQKIKHEAERRAQRRVDKKIDKTFDKAEGTIDKTLSKKEKKENTSAKIFKFTHVYAMQLTDHKNRKVDFEYYLKNNANYLAVNFPNMKSNMISIMDMENGKNIMLMENGNQKTQMTT